MRLLWLGVYGWPWAVVVAVKVSQGKTFLKPVSHYVGGYPFWDAVAWAVQAVDTPCLERQGYESVLEHVVVQFVASCSRICTHELVRHRLASYAQTSTRILGVEAFRPDEESPGHLYPLVERAARGDREALGRLCTIPPWDDGSVAESCRRYFEEIVKHKGRHVDMWLRYAQPDALTAHIMATTNLRELLHIAELRLHPHAHWEIRSLVWELAEKLWQQHQLPFHLMLLLKRPTLAKLNPKLAERAREQLEEIRENLGEEKAAKIERIYQALLS